MRIETQEIERFPRAGDETTERAERFRKSAIDNAHSFFDAEMFDCAATVRSTGQHRMRFIDEDAGFVRIGHVDQFLQITKVAIHRIDAFDDNELTFSFLAG